MVQLSLLVKNTYYCYDYSKPPLYYNYCYTKHYYRILSLSSKSQNLSYIYIYRSCSLRPRLSRVLLPLKIHPPAFYQYLYNTLELGNMLRVLRVCKAINISLQGLFNSLQRRFSLDVCSVFLYSYYTIDRQYKRFQQLQYLIYRLVKVVRIFTTFVAFIYIVQSRYTSTTTYLECFLYRLYLYYYLPTTKIVLYNRTTTILGFIYTKTTLNTPYLYLLQ